MGSNPSPTFAGSSGTSNVLFFLPPPEDCDGNPRDRNGSSRDNRQRVVRSGGDGCYGYAGGHDRGGRRLLTVHIDGPDDVVVHNAGLRGPIDIERGPGGGKWRWGEPRERSGRRRSAVNVVASDRPARDGGPDHMDRSVGEHMAQDPRGSADGSGSDRKESEAEGGIPGSAPAPSGEG